MSESADSAAGTDPSIKRVATAYVPQQDRFRLSVEMESGEVQVLWITQRLLKLALGPLAAYFEKAPRPSDEQKARRSYAELMHKVTGKAKPPVASAEPATEWLVSGLSINYKQPAILFTFKGDEGQRARMEMDPLKLRQWLALVHRKSVKAGWPEELWPASVVAALD